MPRDRCAEIAHGFSGRRAKVPGRVWGCEGNGIAFDSEGFTHEGSVRLIQKGPKSTVHTRLRWFTTRGLEPATVESTTLGVVSRSKAMAALPSS